MRCAVILNTRSVLAALALFPVLASGLGGCVQQDKYDTLIKANRSLEEQVVALEDERDAARENVSTLRRQLSQTSSELNGLNSENSRLNQSLTDMSARSDDYLRRISRLSVGPLPADVESALTDLAMSYPDVLEFDAGEGMIRFKSDMTFDLGSTALRPEAQTTVDALGKIVNSQSAQGFEVRVVGHTDNVPIRKASTLERHPSNVHLSVHRSIAVRDALVGAGVEPTRIQVAGYGQFRPIVPNRARGAAANRRVEVYLSAMTTFASARQEYAEPATPIQANVADENMK